MDPTKLALCARAMQRSLEARTDWIVLEAAGLVLSLMLTMAAGVVYLLHRRSYYQAAGAVAFMAANAAALYYALPSDSPDVWRTILMALEQRWQRWGE